MKRSLTALAALCSILGAHACNADAVQEPLGTDTGNPHNDNGEGTAGDNCTEEETELELAEQTPLGFSAQSILALAAGEHSSSLVWLDSSAEYGPESGRSEIALSVESLGAARFIDREPRASSGEEGGTLLGTEEGYSPCRDSVEIDVRIDVSTAGGALDELIDTTLVASQGDFARSYFRLDLEDVEGAFTATPVAPNNSELTRATLNFELGFSDYGAVGAMSLQSEFRTLDGNAVGQGGGGEIAHFPADDYCGPTAVSVTADQEVRGLSMAQALGALNAMSPADVSYASGAPSELTLAFSSAEQRVCASLTDGLGGVSSPNATTLEFPGVVTLLSSDGRIDGNVPLQIVASTEYGGLTVNAQGNVDGAPAEVAALPLQFGVRDPVDFSGYDGGFVQFLSIASDSATGGSLKVYGLDVADCVTNPPPPDPDGMSSPGCRGTDRIPLWTASWGDTTD